MKKIKAKVLIYDIETLFNEGYFFGLFEQNIGHNFIVKEKSVLTIAYKWYGEKQSHVLTLADFGNFKKDPHDDKKLIEAFSKVLEQADYTVAHYGDKFDLKFIASRALINNLPPIPTVPSIDTYKLVKKHFNLNANRLDYIGKLLGFGGKMPMDWSYWKRCAQGDTGALNKMAAYNKQDVVLLEKVFDKVLPYVDSKLNAGLFKDCDSSCACPTCESSNTHKKGYWVNKVSKYQRYHCQECGKWYKGEKIDRDR